nr:hypothetical protein [uncultured Sphingomonas sp.]
MYNPFSSQKLVTHQISDKTLWSQTQPSLFVAGSLTRSYAPNHNSHGGFLPHGPISELGFTEVVSQPLKSIGVDERHFEGGWVSQRSLALDVAPKLRRLAFVEVREARAYDEYQRGNIDFTGFLISLSLRDDAFRAILELLMPWTEDSDNRRLAFIIPTARFAFPKPRGSDDPWNSRDAVGKLAVIRRFTIDSLDVISMTTIPERGSDPGNGVLERYLPHATSILRLETYGSGA